MHDSTYPLEFLFDGQCRICLYDVAHLRQLDKAGRLIFVDASAADFDAAPYGGDREALLARIHARLADGRMVAGVEVFRLALGAVGYAWLVAPTRWPGLSQFSELAYSVFARHRITLSRRFGGLFARLTPECDAHVCQHKGD